MVVDAKFTVAGVTRDAVLGGHFPGSLDLQALNSWLRQG